jgi:hypothetical protein
LHLFYVLLRPKGAMHFAISRAGELNNSILLGEPYSIILEIG